MKTGSIIWMCIALLFSSAAGFSQVGRPLPGRAYKGGNGPGTCLNVLADLTEEQKAKISELETTHQQAMAGLRVTQRSAFELDTRDSIRIEMLQKVRAHRKEVRNLLTDDQQKQYDMLHGQYGFAARRYPEGRAPGRWQRGYGRRGFRGGW